MALVVVWCLGLIFLIRRLLDSSGYAVFHSVSLTVVTGCFNLAGTWDHDCLVAKELLGCWHKGKTNAFAMWCCFPTSWCKRRCIFLGTLQLYLEIFSECVTAGMLRSIIYQMVWVRDGWSVARSLFISHLHRLLPIQLLYSISSIASVWTSPTLYSGWLCHQNAVEKFSLYFLL